MGSGLCYAAPQQKSTQQIYENCDQKQRAISLSQTSQLLHASAAALSQTRLAAMGESKNALFKAFQSTSEKKCALAILSELPHVHPQYSLLKVSAGFYRFLQVSKAF
jgi:hypothetical protein